MHGRSKQTVVLLVVAALVIACSDDEPDILRIDAAAAPVELYGCDAPGLITAERAMELALVAAATFGPFRRDRLFEEHGAEFAFESLEVTSQVLCAASPYAPPNQPIFRGYEKLVGPYYIVHIHSASTPVMLVAVSALNTDIRIDDGTIRFPQFFGSDFFMRGYRADSDSPDLMTPNAVTASIEARLGVMPERTPRFQRRALRHLPPDGVWLVDLSDYVQLTRGSETFATNRIYLDRRGNLFVAAAPISPPEQLRDDLFDPTSRYTQTFLAAGHFVRVD